MDEFLALSLEPLEFVLQIHRARLLRIIILEGPEVDRAEAGDGRIAVRDRRLQLLEAGKASFLQLDRHLLHHAFGLRELLLLDLELRLHLEEEVLFRVDLVRHLVEVRLAVRLLLVRGVPGVLEVLDLLAHLGFRLLEATDLGLEAAQGFLE